MGINAPRIMSAFMYVAGFPYSKHFWLVILFNANIDCRSRKRQSKGRYMSASALHRDNALQLGWSIKVIGFIHGTGLDLDSVWEDSVSYSWFLMLHSLWFLCQTRTQIEESPENRGWEYWHSPLTNQSDHKCTGFSCFSLSYMCSGDLIALGLCTCIFYAGEKHVCFVP